MDALCDDLNTPKAIAELVTLAKKAASEKTPEAKSTALAAAKLLNIAQENPSEWLGYGEGRSKDKEKINALIEKRNKARAKKDFAASDKIRDELTAMGIAIEDTPEGTLWKKA